MRVVSTLMPWVDTKDGSFAMDQSYALSTSAKDVVALT